MTTQTTINSALQSRLQYEQATSDGKAACIVYNTNLQKFYCLTPEAYSIIKDGAEYVLIVENKL